VTVTNVVDGDTVDVRWPNGTEDTVRLVGVDTPEVYVETDPPEWEDVPDTDAGHTCLRDAGHAASAFVTRSLEGQTVEISFDANLDRRGYYGRLLAYLHVDGETINYQLVAAGHARVYDSDFAERDGFEAAEADAQTTRQNAWDCRSLADDTTGDDGTDDSATNDTAGDALAVDRVHADAAGNDYDNLNDEYVVFTNTGGDTLELSGWTVADAAGHSYTVPAGTTLDSGATLTLRTGRGTNTATDLHWGAGAPVWNNAGDTVVVTDDAGQQRLAYSYE
jgi:micrococcal nuclease